MYPYIFVSALTRYAMGGNKYYYYYIIITYCTLGLPHSWSHLTLLPRTTLLLTNFKTLWHRDRSKGQSIGLVIEKLQVRVPAGAPEFFFQGQLSVPTFISISVQKESGHSAKNVSGTLQLNMHAPYICGFA